MPEHPGTLINIREDYVSFDAPVTDIDCGRQCAPNNPSGKPFCCDICQAVPAVYRQEWDYLRLSTDLWHVWRGDECREKPEDPSLLIADTPGNMLLLACLGPAHCQRPFRALSCRQFPFFPYITAGLQFIGLAYEWEFEHTCWVISHLERVTDVYRREFIRFYDRLFSDWPEEFNSYVLRSEELRTEFASQRRRFVILHRRGGFYRVSPVSERRQRIQVDQLPRFGPYRLE